MPEIGRGLVDLRIPQEFRNRQRRFRRWRPWMWGPLRRLWTLTWDSAAIGYVFGPDYRWKTRADRKLEKRLEERRCCGVPAGMRCPSHKGGGDQ
jgi:hypothetical protein